jgi:phage baseplate assembly protein V
VQLAINSITLRDAVPVAQLFGFSASMPVGTDVLLLCLGGDPSNGFVIGSNNQALRPVGLKPGEAIVYDSLGRTIKLDAAGGIVVNANNAAVTVNGATTVTINATGGITLADNVHITKALTVDDDATIGGKSFLHHAHSGVQTGSGDTGPPV